MRPKVLPIRVTARQRLPELDGLRAFAILPVLLLHFRPLRGPLAGLAGPLECGWVGVELFFVLSGFLITRLLLEARGRPRYYREFISRRALRILPLYYLVVGLVLLSALLRPDAGRWEDLMRWGNPAWFAFYLGNVPAVLKNALPPVPSLTPLWSLQIEEQYYLLYPLLVASLQTRTLRRVLIACVVLAPALRVLLTMLQPHAWVACYVLTPLRMDALGLGGLVAVLQHERRPLSPRLLLAVAGVATAGAAAILVFASAWQGHPLTRTLGYSLVDLGAAAITALITSGPPAWLARLLRAAPLVYTGRISYGLYLWHFPAAGIALRILHPVLGVNPGDSLALPLSLIATFAVAALSWQLFEQPLMALHKRAVA